MRNHSNKNLPADYLAGLKENWRSDALSGFLVFLIAMPLSLGIAKASEFPPVMGLLTAIIGGVVVSILAGSKLTIKGPAAGLIVIVAGAVNEFGAGNPDPLHGWHLALGTIVVAGVIQILFGLLKLGSLSEFFPNSVIHGMLAAIGLIIFSKQIHTLLGIDPATLKGKEPLELYEMIPNSIMNANPKIALIGVLGLVIVFGLPNINNRFIKRIPSPVIVLLLAIPLAMWLDFKGTEPAYAMVKVGKFMDEVKINVDFSGWHQTGIFVKYVILFALIGSIESLLTVKAIDGLDPHKRKSDTNRDLIAVGLGNTLSGILGGLPMISEVARSSANVNNGAKTRWANFFHGVFLLLSVIAIPFVMELIPNAALAALLIGVGYRLASPKEFINTYKIGSEQLIIFSTTIFFTLFVDLLVGVFAGIFIKLVIELMNGASFNTMFSIKAQVEKKGQDLYEVKITSPATFSNLISFKKQFDLIPNTANVTLDFAESRLIDHTFMEMLHRYEEDFHDNGGHISLIGFENHHYSSLHPFSLRTYLNNPSIITRNTLNKRQQELADYAMANGLEFEERIKSKMVKLSLSPFMIARKAKTIENLLVGSTDNYNYFFADIYLEEGAYLTKMGRNMTVVYVSGIRNELPDFSLEKEGLLDLLGFSASQDIDFKNYPLFSKRYLLTSNAPNKVRSLFSDDLIRFFETENNIFVECVNNSLLIHSDSGLLEANDLEAYTEKVKKLLGLLFR
ncbi:MAG TPA: sulfate transporter [Cytophagales bacterium]|nr:sulfate transporter [Cytophagales bacterium]